CACFPIGVPPFACLFSRKNFTGNNHPADNELYYEYKDEGGRQGGVELRGDMDGRVVKTQCGSPEEDKGTRNANQIAETSQHETTFSSLHINEIKEGPIPLSEELVCRDTDQHHDQHETEAPQR